MIFIRIFFLLHNATFAFETKASSTNYALPFINKRRNIFFYSLLKNGFFLANAI